MKGARLVEAVKRLKTYLCGGKRPQVLVDRESSERGSLGCEVSCKLSVVRELLRSVSLRVQHCEVRVESVQIWCGVVVGSKKKVTGKRQHAELFTYPASACTIPIWKYENEIRRVVTRLSSAGRGLRFMMSFSGFSYLHVVENSNRNVLKKSRKRKRKRKHTQAKWRGSCQFPSQCTE